MSKRLTQEEFIEKARKVHGNKYDYSKVEYSNAKTKILIICPTHGEFCQEPFSHLVGNGCMKCYRERQHELKASNTEDFICKAKSKHGDKYDYSKTEYINAHAKVCIICKEHGIFYQTPNSHLNGNGCPKCARIKTKVCGVGICDLDIKVGGYNDAYSHWHNMIHRCYDSSLKEKQLCYKECVLDKNWLLFSNFKKWFDEHSVDDWALDKDILVKGNKVYSPNTCCFVPQEINSLLTTSKKARGEYPIGVCRKGEKYGATLNCNKTRVYLGTFDTITDAFNVYKKMKEKRIKEIADKWKDKIEPRVYEAMYNYKVEITD